MLNRRRFIRNGIILIISSLILRFIGVGFGVYITSMVGAAGTGLFQLVMSVYSPALTLSSAGVGLASSRLVAEEMGKSRGGSWRAAFYRCLLFSVLCSLPVALSLFFLAPSISRSWLGSGDAAILLKMLSLGLPFISLSSCISGFFIAVKSAGHTALLQLSEQSFKIILTVLLIRLFGNDPSVCLYAVVFCNVCSDIFSASLSALLCRGRTKRIALSGKRKCTGLSGRILSITLPVSVSSFLRSSLVALEHILIPKGLEKSGMKHSDALSAYGTVSGMALPIILFPASFIYPFSSLIIPEMAEDKGKNDIISIKNKIDRLLYAVLLFSIGASVMIFGFSGELGASVYGSADAAKYIMLLSPIIPIMYLDNITDAALKGLGEQIFTMKVNVLDAACCVVSVFFLVPKMRILGYIFVILTSELINFSFSFLRLKKVVGVSPRLLSRAPRLIVCALISIAASKAAVHPLSSPSLKAVLGCALFSAIYFGTLYISRLLAQRLQGIKERGDKYNSCIKEKLTCLRK